jgi:histidinol phosphatase-like PHP family hydrolase
MNLFAINLHIHSTYSDGKNSIEMIVREAKNSKLRFIAITDHFSSSWKANIIPTLNSEQKMDSYLRELHQFQKKLILENDEMMLLKGIELDTTSSIDYIYKNIRPNSFDIILFEYLNTPGSISSISNLLKTWNKENPSITAQSIYGLAHLDPLNFLYDDFKMLISFLKQFNVFYEFNSSYPHTYAKKYDRLFEKLKQQEIMISIGADSHELSSIFDIQDPLSMIEHYGLQMNYQLLLNRLIRLKNHYYECNFIK